VAAAATASKLPFHVRVKDRRGATSEDARLTVYDGRDEVLAEEVGEVKLELPRGLYTVRVERAGSTVEKVYRHETSTDLVIDEPLRVSATPVFDTATTHEYYAYTSAEWSGKDTRSPFAAAGHAPTGRVFVFLRTLDMQSYRGENLAAGLRLLDSQGALVSAFTESEVRRSDEGWLALSARAEPGSYVLRFDGEPAREMPLYTYPHFSTQLFASYVGSRSKSGAGRLRLDTAAILMPRADESFNPDDRIAQAVDSALAGLQLGSNFMPRGAMRTLLEGKFENPMLGLLGAHLLLKQREAQTESPSGSRTDSQLDVIVGNLNSLLPKSPDVQALRLLIAERRGQVPPPQPFERPPMLRVGFEAVLRASARQPELVPDDGLLERAATRALVDSPWTSWEPLFEVAAEPPAPSSQETYAVSRSAPGGTGEATPVEVDWLSSYLGDAVRRTQRTQRSLDVKHLASQVGVPVRIVERRLASLNVADTSAEPADDLTQIYGIGQTFQRVLKDLGYRTYGQIASLDQEDIERINRRLGRHASRLVQDDWIDQARKLTSSEE